MTVSDLIDYLQQFDKDVRVFLTEESASESDYRGDYISLDFISFD